MRMNKAISCGVFAVALFAVGCDKEGGSLDDEGGNGTETGETGDSGTEDTGTSDTGTSEDTGTETGTDTGTGTGTDTGTETGTETGTDTDTGTDTGTDTTDTDGELAPEDLAEIDAVAGELEMIVAGALAHFALEQAAEPFHRCPHPLGSPLGGEASYTPTLAFDCNEGEMGKCLPIHNGGGAGQYDMGLWEDNSVWVDVGWMRPEGVLHEFHYNFIAVNSNTENGYGACTFTAEARGDFDGDFVFSSYSLSGTVDEQGANVGEIVIVDPFE